MKKQSGRSMVEMLGTLAIIGVLSVTALTGYKIAMTKNRTNNILYDVNLAMNEIATREYLSLPEITQHVRDLGVRTELDIVYARNGGTESSGFFIQVNGVTEAVCETLRSNKTAFMSSIQPYSGNAKANACAEGIDVRAEFQYPPVEGGNDTSTVACQAGLERLSNGSCCSSDYVCGDVCCPPDQCINETCYGEAGEECPNGYADNYGECCEDNEIILYQTVFGGGYHCCPSNAVAVTQDFSTMAALCIFKEGDKLVCENGKVAFMADGNDYYTCCDVDEFYFEDSCNPCPSGATCDGTATVVCSTGYYFDGVDCVDCPSGATCDGTTTVTCNSGTWDGNNQCCADDDGECI